MEFYQSKNGDIFERKELVDAFTVCYKIGKTNETFEQWLDSLTLLPNGVEIIVSYRLDLEDKKDSTYINGCQIFVEEDILKCKEDVITFLKDLMNTLKTKISDKEYLSKLTNRMQEMITEIQNHDESSTVVSLDLFDVEKIDEIHPHCHMEVFFNFENFEKTLDNCQ